jgi:hypothetical protein
MGIGFSVNALNKQEIKDFINGLTEEGIMEKVETLSGISKDFAINKNPELFEYLRNFQEC